jgi:hypothetical protein
LKTIVGLLFIVQLGRLPTMLADIWQNVPKIIQEAAASPLGMLALMIIALAILAFFFFKNAGVPVRIAIFIILFAAVVVFAAKVAYKANEVEALLKAAPGVVERGGAVTPAPQETQAKANATPTPTPTPTAANSSPTATPELSTDIDKPTPLTSNEIRGNGVGEVVSYYCTFNAGPGEVQVTVDGKNTTPRGEFPHDGVGGFTKPIAVEISDLHANSLFRINLGYTQLGGRKIDSFRLPRRQQVKLRILLSQDTLDYMVRVEGKIDFSPATKVQGPQ